MRLQKKAPRQATFDEKLKMALSKATSKHEAWQDGYSIWASEWNVTDRSESPTKLGNRYVVSGNMTVQRRRLTDNVMRPPLNREFKIVFEDSKDQYGLYTVRVTGFSLNL